MSSRRPRSQFAAPLVVTLATVPACMARTGSSAPAPRTGDGADGTVVIANPPRPIPDGGGGGGDVTRQDPPHTPTRWTVFAQGDGGGCYAIMDATCPPPPATCNPPPPQKLATCPAGATATASVEVRELSPGECYVIPPMPACPPDASCNPPRPTKIDCPTW
jgi:hypothetical protein